MSIKLVPYCNGAAQHYVKLVPYCNGAAQPCAYVIYCVIVYVCRNLEGGPHELNGWDIYNFPKEMDRQGVCLTSTLRLLFNAATDFS